MKGLLTLMTAGLLGLCAGACGGADAGSARRSSSAVGASAGLAPSAALPQIELKADSDSDSDRYGSEPDNESEVFGHPADAADARAVAMLMGRYYAAATVGDGVEACRLLYLTFAESVAEDFGGASGSPGVHGKTCAAVMSEVFKQSHTRFGVDSATLKVAAVRVDRNIGSARLGFAGRKPDRYILVHRERGAWKLTMLFDIGRPVGVE
jgi:hypothetical protein